MRIPLEVLRIFLLNAETQLTRSEFMQLRLVNTVFDEEIVSCLFSDHRPQHEPRLINGSTWDSAPSSLRQRYTRFRLKMRKREPNLFAYLFLPVFERYLAQLQIAEEDAERREAVMNDLLRLTMHEQKMSWVIAHKRKKLSLFIDRTLSHEFDLEEPESKYINVDHAVLREQQIDNDYQFALVCSAMLADDEETVLRMVQEEKVNIKRVSHCFGASMLRFALRHGSVETIRLMLNQTWQLESSHQANYELFVLAAKRPASSSEAVTLVLEYAVALTGFPSYHHKCKNMLDWVLQKTCQENHVVIVDSIINWLQLNWVMEIPAAKQWFLDRAFTTALRSGNFLIIERLCREVDLSSSFDGYMPINSAARAGNTDVALLSLLIEHGAEIEKPEHLSCEMAPIFQAAHKGLADWVEMLLNAGANPQSEFGQTPLLFVAEHGGIFKEVSLLLESYGWDVEDLEDKKGNAEKKEGDERV